MVEQDGWCVEWRRELNQQKRAYSFLRRCQKATATTFAFRKGHDLFKVRRKEHSPTITLFLHIALHPHCMEDLFVHLYIFLYS